MTMITRATKVYDDKTTIPEVIRDLLKVGNGTRVIWLLDVQAKKVEVTFEPFKPGGAE